MSKVITLSLNPIDANFDESINDFICKKLNSKNIKEENWRILKKSIDARKKNVKILLKIEVSQKKILKNQKIERNYKNVSNSEEVIIIGSGPAGLFAALTLLENGKKPILFERGKDVRSRRRDIAAINKHHEVNPDSNYCFGEGGAGTYSDGKLYTRSKKRGSIINILETLVFHGAKEEILIESQPHIGTNKLPNIIANIRQTILSCGGEIHFNTKVVDFIITNNSIKGVVLENKHKVLAKNTILATGHSARDIFYLLNKRSIEILNKPFAMGIRIEHPQELIDQIQYSCNDRGSYLPPASYKLVTQINNRGVYSFCMCPGGFIVPAATNKGEIVVNGMSPSKRNSFFSNSGIVVEVKEEDLFKYKKHGNLKGLKYQIELEKSMCKSSPDLQIAPAQKMIDFINKKTSNNLNKTSYQPGLISEPLHEILPKNIVDCLSGSFNVFGKKMKGFLTNEANIIGLESRTSSPLSIPRDNQTLQHIKIKNLFPCGEGAGYAGGIVSAAIDGKKVAEKI
ncbi:MAG: FAD-binding protein [Flavobacteriales bacterium]|nr:FAD-binding protein [Flavobacteriales bacterium]|tara:strand:- start:697 stop:2235 length:1539 start_codon:yes stop_codon:yes gene_type:complete